MEGQKTMPLLVREYFYEYFPFPSIRTDLVNLFWAECVLWVLFGVGFERRREQTTNNKQGS